MPCFPHLHGPHIIISLSEYHSHLCHTRIHHLTTALHEKQFTTIGLTETLNRFTAQKANQFSINHYDHAFARYMEDSFLEDDTNANPQLTENCFIRSQYVLTINCMNKNLITLYLQHFATQKPTTTISKNSTIFSLTF